MDITASAEFGVPPEVLFAWIDDLARYPAWLGIATRAVPATPEPGDAGPAWSVDLRGSLGPLARSKRLRMVREVHEPPRRAVFTRREVDGRTHALWRLTARIESMVGGSRLHMDLHYGGRMLARPVELLLTQEIDRSRQRLLELLSD